jgi:ABC-type multidrug transport system fused ATPase/permease subunit
MFKKMFLFYAHSKHSNMRIMSILIVCLGLFELIGISLFILLLDSSDNLVSKFVDSLFSSIGFDKNDLTISFLIFLIFLLKLFVVIIFNKKITFNMNNFVFEIRNNLIKQFSNAEFIIINKYNIGELNNLITKESEQISVGYFFILNIILKILLTIVYVTLSFLTNIYATLFAILLGFIFVAGFRKIVDLVKVNSKIMVRENDETNSYISEFVYGLKYLFATNGFAKISQRLELRLKSYSIAKYKLEYYGKLSKEVPESIGVLIIISVLVFNYLYIHDSTMSVLMSAVLLYKTFSNITGLQYTYQNLMGVSAPINKVIKFSQKLDKHKERNGLEVIKDIKDIKIEKLHFNYGNLSVIKNLSVNFRKNNIYAFVGGSGVGKTTILNILALLYSVNKDCYLVNDIDSNKIDKYKFRKKIGYVGQESLYFDGSIKENITLFEKYSDDAIEDIIEKTQLLDVVNSKGLDERLKSFGKDLSGGQLQRISIARELIKRPEILILDEATSALDANMERIIMSHILTLKKDMIIIIVAHRLSVLAGADQILYLDKEGVVERGNMHELYNNNNKFKIMCNNQKIFMNKNA